MVSTRKRLVLHIGFHRAGSAAVHESLFGARVALRDHEVVYPQPLSGHPSHLDLATSLGFNPRDELGHLDRSAVIERYRRLIDDARPGSVLVIASEEFCLGNFFPEAVENLRIFREKLDVSLTVSAAVRDPIRFLFDIYRTELEKTDLALDFTQWVREFDLTGADFAHRLEVWRSLLGPADDLIVRDVEGDGAHDVDRLAVEGVLADCGLDHSAAPLIRPPGTVLHQHLIEPLLAVRRHSEDPDERQRLLQSLFTISPLLEPVGNAALDHLDASTRTFLEARLFPNDPPTTTGTDEGQP